MQDQNQKEVEIKKPYTPPKLTTHGDAQSLTQGPSIGDCSGLPISLP